PAIPAPPGALDPPAAPELPQLADPADPVAVAAPPSVTGEGTEVAVLSFPDAAAADDPPRHGFVFFGASAQATTTHVRQVERVVRTGSVLGLTRSRTSVTAEAFTRSIVVEAGHDRAHAAGASTHSRRAS